MVKQKQKNLNKSERFWDNVSKRFSGSNRMMNSPALQIVQQKAGIYFTPTDKVLDIGCGPGDITFEIARKTQEVFATDISEGMIGAAKQSAIKKNITNIQFYQTDLLDTKFQSDSFDVITAFSMLQYINDKQDHYVKIFELLRPHGLFISSTPCLRERKSAIRFIMAGLTLLKIVPKILFYKNTELESEIKESGFTIKEASDISKLPERFIIAIKN
jgi:2-polyprenyl-3-methyl-5-hydroxy-6-metoxy-1,4-benzoquinol methylase